MCVIKQIWIWIWTKSDCEKSKIKKSRRESKRKKRIGMIKPQKKLPVQHNRWNIDGIKETKYLLKVNLKYCCRSFNHENAQNRLEYHSSSALYHSPAIESSKTTASNLLYFQSVFTTKQFFSTADRRLLSWTCSTLWEPSNTWSVFASNGSSSRPWSLLLC